MMKPATYVRKIGDLYEYGIISTKYRCTGSLPYSRLTEYIPVSEEYIFKGFALSMEEGRKLADTLMCE